MHSFNDLDLKTLKKICSKYNLHVKIAKYSKLNKEQLIPHMEKHLHINTEGKIKMKKEASEMAESELNKLIHELKNKVKEVKEKVIKHHAKKEDAKEKKQKKTEEQIKEEEIIEALPMYHKLNDYEGVERVTKLNDMCLKMEHFPTIVKCLEGIEQYLEKHPEADKPKPKKEEKPKEDKKENEYKEEERKRKETIKKDEKKKYYMDRIKEEEEQIKRDMEELKVLEGKTKTDNRKIKIQQLNDFIEIGNNRIKELKKQMMEALPEEEKTPMDKIDKIQNELNKLEQLIKIDEKQNEKEHKQLKKEIKESESDEEYIPMKPKKASDVLILKVSEVKDLAKKHNISLKHKVNNKEVAKGGPMLKKEIIKYLKL